MERSMAAEEEAELVFIAISRMGHLPSMVETARKLVARCPVQISITILIMKFPSSENEIESLIQSLKLGSSDNSRISIHELPELNYPPDVNSKYFQRLYMEAYKPIIKQTLLDKKRHHQSLHPPNQAHHYKRLAGLVLDVSCTTMIDMANELGAPSYIFYAAGAPFLCLLLHFLHFGVPDVAPTLNDDQPQQLQNKNWPVVQVPGFRNPIPAKVWPDLILDKDNGWMETLLESARRFQETRGILVNTFAELESHIIHSLTSPKNEHNGGGGGGGDAVVIPPVYPVGPIINLNKDSVDNDSVQNIMSWLDSQPPLSVVFLCFGSRGCFNEKQVKEIAEGLKQSGQRFLWSLRRNPAMGHYSGKNGDIMLRLPEEFDDFEEVLPKGFLTQMAGKGKVIGWAPQASVLGHQAVGAFVSHCGWNSVLESMWFGVPLVAWPLYSEQQLNAFVLLKEFELAVEIRMDYKCNFQGEANIIVGAEVIENAIKKVMTREEEGKKLRKKTKQISEMAKKTLEIGGSSYESMGHFMEDVIRNLF